MTDVASDDLSKSEAKSLTEKIRKSVDGLWSLLLEAYERKAWKALEYKTWESYVKAEFDMSRRNSYRLLAQGKAARAIEEAVGKNVPHAAQISQRDAEVIADDIHGAAAEIKSRVESGTVPRKAVADVVAEKSEERRLRDKKANDAEWKRQQDEFKAGYSPELAASIAAQEAAKAANKTKSDRAGLSDAERIDALEAEVIALEEENAKLKAENKTYSEMKVQFEKGGFEEVIRGKDAEISALKSRVERESKEKVANLNSLEWWKKQAIKLGWTDPNFIPVKGAAANG
jgi:hypothetical protein